MEKVPAVTLCSGSFHIVQTPYYCYCYLILLSLFLFQKDLIKKRSGLLKESFNENRSLMYNYSSE